jgi:DNA-binding transcriptional LysR family regulator
MDRIDLMRTFVRVVERGSFSSVARELGLGQPAVSKQVAALEADLGAELIRRTSRRMAPTEAGQDFYEAALRLLDDFDAAASRLGRGQSAPSGLVRITVAPVFGDGSSRRDWATSSAAIRTCRSSSSSRRSWLP